MRKYSLTVALFLLLVSYVPAFAQKTDPPKSINSAAEASTIPAPPAITDKSTPQELAHAALAAMGGDNFKKMKSSFVMGTANLYAPNSSQSMPATFAIASAGDKVRVDINGGQIGTFKQIYDGQRSFSSIPGVEIPPPSKFGLPVLRKVDDPGYTISAIPDKKKMRGFRIADADGNATDFYLDPATGRVSEYVVPYQGYTFGSSISKFREVDGVLVPVNFTQRFEMGGGGGAYFAEYKVKEVKLNQPIGDDVFVIQ